MYIYFIQRDIWNKNIFSERSQSSEYNNLYVANDYDRSMNIYTWKILNMYIYNIDITDLNEEI